MVDGNVSVPEVTLFYSCGATSGLVQTPCAERGQFPYAKRRSDVEQSARIRRVVRFDSAATIQLREWLRITYVSNNIERQHSWPLTFLAIYIYIYL